VRGGSSSSSIDDLQITEQRRGCPERLIAAAARWMNIEIPLHGGSMHDHCMHLIARKTPVAERAPS
jgi:hypothetical protein